MDEEGDDDCFLEGNRDNSTVLVNTNENKLTEKLIKGKSNFMQIKKNIKQLTELNLNFYKNLPINYFLAVRFDSDQGKLARKSELQGAL